MIIIVSKRRKLPLRRSKFLDFLVSEEKYNARRHGSAASLKGKLNEVVCNCLIGLAAGVEQKFFRKVVRVFKGDREHQFNPVELVDLTRAGVIVNRRDIRLWVMPS